MKQGISLLVEQVIKATERGQMDWRFASPSEQGEFTSPLGGGSIRVSLPVPDQRDGDFCWFTVHDGAGKEVSKTSIQTALYKSIIDGPPDRLIGDMLNDVMGRQG